MGKQRRSIFTRLRKLADRRNRGQRLQLEWLEARRVLASSAVPPAILGTVYIDSNSNSSPDSGEEVVGASVELFLDDGDGVFEPGADDTQVGSAATSDSNGQYCFDGLDPDAQYWIRQPAQTVGSTALSEVTSSLLSPGTPGLLIDSFEDAQVATATFATPNASNTLDTGSEATVLGQERDLAVALTSGTSLSLQVDQPGADDVLTFETSSGGAGSYTLIWDGVDGDADTLAFGLNDRDLTDGGANTGFFLRVGVDPNGGDMRFRIYDDNSTNFSEVTASLPMTTGGLPTGFVFVPFSSLVGPVSPDQVDAIELMIQATSPVNGQASFFGTMGPLTQNLQNAAEVDLLVAKFSPNTNISPGQQITYNVSVQNVGSLDVSGATVTDVMPVALSGINYNSTAQGGATGNTSFGTGNINDTVNLPVGSSIIYVITGTVVSSASGSISNTATISPPGGVADSNPSNNSSTQTNNVVRNIDLAITKTDGQTTVSNGEQIEYIIDVSNNGPSDVLGARVTDSFPADLTNITYTSEVVTGTVSGNTASGSGDIDDTVNMNNGAVLRYTVQATVSTTAAGTISNTALIATPSGYNEPVVDNNSQTDTDTVVPAVDVSVTKTDGVTSAVPGESVTYTIVASNAGPAAVTGATLTDTFPAELINVSYTSTASGGATGNSPSGAGNLNETLTMPSGSSVTYTVTATVAPDAHITATDLINTASVSVPSTVQDTDTSNNSATDTDTWDAQVDLTITKDDSVTTVEPNDAVTYQIVVSNSGPSDASGVSITDTFPASLTGVAFTSVASGGATGNTASGSGDLNETVDMPAGSSITYTVMATVSASASGTIDNTATVAAPTGVTDTDTSNNSATDSDTVTQTTDLSLSKTNSTSQVTPGGTVQYDIVVTNSGPSDVTGATVADVFPTSLSNVTYTSSVTGGATGNTASGSDNINDSVNMPSGSTITYQVTGTISPTATGTLSNTATVTAPAGITDSNTANNSDTETDTLAPQVDLSVTKTDSVTTVSPGQALTYTIVVSNSGPSSVTGATLTDTFPANLTGVSFTSVVSGGATGNTASGSGNLNESLTLPPGSSVTYTVNGSVSSSATSGQLVNTATIAAPNGVTETNSANNSATDTDTINAQVDLSVTKTDNVTTVTPGQAVTYTIVVSNAGPATATGATLTDSFPATLTGVTFTSTSSSGATGNTASGSGNLNETLTLPSGSSVTYTVNATVSGSASQGASIANTATVTAPTSVTDTNSANNTATDTDTVSAQVDLSVTKTDNATTVNPGQAVAYTIVVSNAGPATATGATLVDSFPATLTGVTFTSTSSGGATGNTASGTGNLNETLTLPSGSSVTYTVNATVSSSANDGASIANTATVTAPTAVTDTNTSNNSATDTDTVQSMRGSIAGRIFYDADSNGLFNTGDTALNGVTVQLEGPLNTSQSATQTATTDSNGNYQFSNLVSGQYRVTETQPSYLQDGTDVVGTGQNPNTTGSNPANDQFFIQLAAGDTASGFNFTEGVPILSKRSLLASTPGNGT